ncbi:MAG: hypothetical protein R3Y06_12270 [Faecalibacterium sp.]
MPQTKLTIDGEKFRINSALTYSELPTCKEKYHGMLMNSRMIQGIFDSKNRAQFDRFGKTFDPDTNTDDLIAALPAWYAKGLRGITVGMQGGGACFTVRGHALENNPYSADGTVVDPAYLDRLDRLITACDALGMVVIVSYFYCHNIQHLNGAQAVLNATKAMSLFLEEKGYTNVIIEIANEYELMQYGAFPIIREAQGMVALIELAKTYAPNIPVGCSLSGGQINAEVCAASDVVLIHGNGQSRGKLYNLIRKAHEFAPGRPVVINEDSQAIGQLAVCAELATSWGYYNNMTKQEPPCDWGITKGEDTYFAWRMADMLGIPQEAIAPDEQYYLQGFEEGYCIGGMRWLRVASLYPETIDYVRFYCNDEVYYTAYDESFMVNYTDNWRQDGAAMVAGDVWKAEVVLRSGQVKELCCE